MHEPVFPYGPVVASAVFKSRPGDFEVSEELGFEPAGEGEHLFLLVEKSGLSTRELIDCIARDYSLDPKLIGYSGLKDKHALTRQWLSLHLPGKSPACGLIEGSGYQVLKQARHTRKLRPGSHSYNAFKVRLHDVVDFSEPAREQLDAIAGRGFANYFGTQRFGRRQDNVKLALNELPRRRLKRSRRSLLISALRSYLFNRVLAQRIHLGHWDLPLNGDVFMLRGTHSIFTDTLDDTLFDRYRLLDIACTGSLYGTGQNLLSGEPRSIEARVYAECEEITSCLDQQGAKLQMRALRAVVDNFSYDYDAGNRSLLLQADLPSGCYMTTLLEHFIKARDVS
ncbi:MAG: tRNA pseudouridine(13) synthase TruD [Gammaproteobacteria bacterium]|nr:tRNA pseudouridine(13) synthase TruD [Gammaproteobacteria bacterium]